VVDRLKNTDKESVLFTIDTIDPTVSITNPTSSIFDQDRVTLTYTVSEGLVTIYTNGIVNTTAQQSGSVFSDLAVGIYTITIVSVDSAGNTGMATVTFTIDTSTSTTPISTSIVYETTWVTQTKTTAEFATVAMLAGISGVFLFRKKRRNG
jgi:hypothetical protein